MTTLFRAEDHRLLYMSLPQRAVGAIQGEDLEWARRWAETGEPNPLTHRLDAAGVLSADEWVRSSQRGEIGRLLSECRSRQAPLRSARAPDLIHVELTTRCPLRCPQCYNAGSADNRVIDFDRLMGFLQEAAELRVWTIALSGGEPLAYPRLVEVVERIRQLGMCSTMSTSGCGLTERRLAALERAGMGTIWVSLNGSTEEIHNRSRDRFVDAVKALELLSKTRVSYGINWVARQDNAADLPNVVALAQRYGAQTISILRNKPDANGSVESALTGDGFAALARFVSACGDSQPAITVEGCYAELRTAVAPNRYAGLMAGCGAGRRLMAIDVDGRFLPCRHLFYPETWESIKAFWYGSAQLDQLRRVEENIGEPCRDCEHVRHCRTCRATCSARDGDFFAGARDCAVHG